MRPSSSMRITSLAPASRYAAAFSSNHFSVLPGEATSTQISGARGAGSSRIFSIAAVQQTSGTRTPIRVLIATLVADVPPSWACSCREIPLAMTWCRFDASGARSSSPYWSISGRPSSGITGASRSQRSAAAARVSAGMSTANMRRLSLGLTLLALVAYCLREGENPRTGSIWNMAPGTIRRLRSVRSASCWPRTGGTWIGCRTQVLNAAAGAGTIRNREKIGRTRRESPRTADRPKRSGRHSELTDHTDAGGGGFLGPGGRVLGRFHLHHLGEELLLRRGVVDGDDLDRSGELLLAEEDIANVGRAHCRSGI